MDALVTFQWRMLAATMALEDGKIAAGRCKRVAIARCCASPPGRLLRRRNSEVRARRFLAEIYLDPPGLRGDPRPSCFGKIFSSNASP